MYEKLYIVPRTSLKTKLLILAAAVPGLLLTITMLAFIIVAAEDPDATTDVTFDNQTGQTTYVYISDRVEATVPAHLSLTISVWQGHWILGHRLEVRDAAGRVLFATKLGNDDPERLQYHIFIRAP